MEMMDLFFFFFSFELALSRYARTSSRSRHTLVLRTLRDAPPAETTREATGFWRTVSSSLSPPIARRPARDGPRDTRPRDERSVVNAGPLRVVSPCLAISIISINATTESGDAVPTF